MNKKNKGFRNKDPRYFEKLSESKKKLKYFFLKESKAKLGKDFKHGTQNRTSNQKTR
jgi:patatin-like phospholipase/acyl hydrolase